MPARKKAAIALIAPLVFLLYFYGLTRVGMLGPDEPRYASIGRAMALSGDWVTPRLWGSPWFEKPALLYWMTGVARRAGLGDELAPRLPVALMSVAFLAFYWARLRREFGPCAANYATGMLATSAGWLAFSQAGVTDLPMSAAFAAAMVLALAWLRDGGWRKAAGIGALLGVAVLAKGLVPLVLAAPLVWFGRRRWREILLLGVALLAVAAPWYLLCWQHNGAAFIDDFFWKHHFGRFANDALKHRQPFWFYLPVLAGLLIPWTPMAALVRPRFWHDEGLRFLLVTAAFGLVFFSSSTNKLPGYVLPLLPLVFAVLGAAFDKAGARGPALAACALLTALFPIAGAVLPEALATGLSRSSIEWTAWLGVVPAVLLAAVCWRIASRGLPVLAGGLVVLAVAFGIGWLKFRVFPEADRLASARPVWREIKGSESEACVEPVHRALRYGLNYYSVNPLPDCAARPARIKIRQEPRGGLYIVKR